MTAMTCSRVTPAFTVRMTITPVIVGAVPFAWATDGWAMEVPTRVRVSAKTTLRIAFIGHVSPITAVSGAPDLQVRCKAAFRDRLFAIMLTGYEAELHSQARCARRRGGVPERRTAPQLSQSGRGTRRDTVGDQPVGPHP